MHCSLLSIIYDQVYMTTVYTQLYVGMYLCIYVCMYVCMYGWMDGWMDAGYTYYIHIIYDMLYIVVLAYIYMQLGGVSIVTSMSGYTLVT